MTPYYQHAGLPSIDGIFLKLFWSIFSILFFYYWMTMPTENNKICIMVGIFGLLEKSNRYPVMNLFPFITTSLAFFFSSYYCFMSGFFPSLTITRNFSALPSRMRFLLYIFGLPGAHARPRTKFPDRMKIGYWSTKLLATPFTNSFFSIASARIFLSVFRYIIAFLRAVFLVPLSGANTFFTTYRAWLHDSFAPSMSKITFCRTPFRIFSAIERIKKFTTLDAFVDFFRSHILIIPSTSYIVNKVIEIEEKYCEIAVRRLAQEVLPLW